MKSAFIFPGQGAQTVGMGKDIAKAFPDAANLFEIADKIAGFELSRICFEGPAERLNTTACSQPAIFVTSAAILQAVRNTAAAENLVPDVAAGLSLGEYTALYAAGLLAFEDALKLVIKRGLAMQDAAEQNPGSMVSIIGLDQRQVEQLCEKAAQGELLRPVNFNCPGQIVISGAISACKRAEKLAPEFGAIKAVTLQVAGAFHTEMMAPAAQALTNALQDCKIEDPGRTRVIANISAEYYQNADQIKQGLAKQLTNPILWQMSVEKLIADGIEQFYEIGPGRVLTGLMKRINRKARITNLSTLQALQQYTA